MSDDPSSKKLADVRREACEFLSNDDFRTTEKVRHDGTKNGFTECRMIDFLHDLLESGFDFHEVQLGEPPGSGGVGYVLNNADGKGLYIKFKLEWKHLLLLSFDLSKHYRSD